MTSRYHEIMKTKQYLPFRMSYLTEAMVARAQEELGETEEVKANAIFEFRNMVHDEDDLECPTDDNYLLQYLRPRKYNVKKAFGLLKNYYNVKKNHGDLYDSFDPESLKRSFGINALSFMPYRDADGSVIFIIQMSKWDPDTVPIDEGMTALTASILFCVEDIATQVCGVQILVDAKGASLKQIRCLTPRYMNLFSKALRNCLPVRFKGIHMCNESVIFGYFWSIFKFFLSEKIKKRVHFHGDNQKHLHKFLPKAILPSEYGGDNTLCSTDNWFNNEIETHFFERYKELTTYGYRD